MYSSDVCSLCEIRLTCTISGISICCMPSTEYEALTTTLHYDKDTKIKTKLYAKQIDPDVTIDKNVDE